MFKKLLQGLKEAFRKREDPLAEARAQLEQLTDARRRDEQRRRRAQEDHEVLERMDAALVEEGKPEEGKESLNERQRLMIARRIKELRAKKVHLNHNIEEIYNKRIKVFNEHIASLTTVVEGGVEVVPDKKSIEAMAIRSKLLLEDLEKTHELAKGIERSKEAPTTDPEELAILREMRGEAPEPEEETPTMAEAMLEVALGEKKGEEPPVAEKPKAEKVPERRVEEPPMFEQ